MRDMVMKCLIVSWASIFDEMNVCIDQVAWGSKQPKQEGKDNSAVFELLMPS